MNCIICGSDKVEERDTIISDFVMARIDPDFEEKGVNRKTKLCFCKYCTFAFYEYRFSEKEEMCLYRNYRDDEYQKTREKYECWYTKKVNNAINTGDVARQRRLIKKVLEVHQLNVFKEALDYGGNKGATFYKNLGTKNQYVFDVSGVLPLPGIKRIQSLDELYLHHYDFIMCNMVFEHLTKPYEIMKRLYEIGDDDTVYYIEVPSENPFIHGNKFSIVKNLSLLFDRNYSWINLVRYYFQQRKQPFMPMKEHINFFTPKSIKIMAENSAFNVLDIQENSMGNSTVLSMLFKKEVS